MEYLENKDWKEYYEETDPQERKRIYEELIQKVPDDGANELRKRLFELRHVNPKKPEKKVDNGVWQMVVMPMNLRFQYRFSKQTKEEIRKSLTAMGNDEARDEVSISAVYWEMRNVARRYYESCNGPRYARKYFGIMQSSQEEKLQRTATDVYAMVEGVPKHFEMEEEMQIFSDALRDEFVSISRDASQIYSSVVIDQRNGEEGLDQIIRWFKGY